MSGERTRNAQEQDGDAPERESVLGREEDRNALGSCRKLTGIQFSQPFCLPSPHALSTAQRVACSTNHTRPDRNASLPIQKGPYKGPFLNIGARPGPLRSIRGSITLKIPKADRSRRIVRQRVTTKMRQGDVALRRSGGKVQVCATRVAQIDGLNERRVGKVSVASILLDPA